MFGKYNDTPAAISLGIYLLGGLFYTVQLLFMTEAGWKETGSAPKQLVLLEFWALPGSA